MKFSARSGIASFGVVAALLVSASFANAQEGKLSFSGFADLRFSNYTIEKDGPNVSTANAESGFGVEDGAFYVGYAKNNWSLFLDAPFRREKNSDDGGVAGTTGNGSNGSNILFGGDKAQVYAKYMIMEGLHFQVGQWDTIFGIEANDSKDRLFGKTSLVFDQMVPVTHTGALLGWAGHGFHAKAMAANANGKGTLGNNAPAAANDTSGNNKTEYGAAFGWANEMFRAQLGYLSRSTNKVNSAPLKHDSRTLTDVTFGVTWEALTVDLEYAMIDDPSKNTLTTNAAVAAESTDSEKDGTGLLALVGYKFTDEFSLGVRYEMLTNDPGLSAQWKDATAYGVVVHHKLDENFQARAEYNMYSYDNISTAATAKDWDESRFNLALLASF